jgi:hypothetical protein
MIVALLVLIVLILLFGAGVVKGWLANVAGLGCGGLVILVALLWLDSFFGENGVIYIVYGVGAVLALLVVAKLAMAPGKPAAESPFSLTKNISPLSDEPRDKIWQRWSPDINHNFSCEAQERANYLYYNNDHAELDAFCREEMSMRRL